LYPCWEAFTWAVVHDSNTKGGGTRTLKSDHTRAIVECSKAHDDPFCEYRVYATWNDYRDEVQVATYKGTHTNARYGKAKNDAGNNVSYLLPFGRKIWNANRNIKAKAMADSLRGECGREVPLHTACRILKALEDNAFGETTEAYTKLVAYLRAYKEEDPDSVVHWEVEQGVFARGFIMPSAADHLLKHCRPVVGIDGSFTKGQVRKHILLLLVMQDWNKNCMPVAAALVRSENNEDWNWFMQCCCEHE
jgi:hypothetical protein